MGRPAALTSKQIDKLVELVEGMVVQADANYEVTLGMVLRRSRFKVSQRTAARALHKRGYRFRKLRSKMILTPQDIAERYAWAKKYKNRPRQWWLDKAESCNDAEGAEGGWTPGDNALAPPSGGPNNKSCALLENLCENACAGTAD